MTQPSNRLAMTILVPWDKPTETILDYTQHPASAVWPAHPAEVYIVMRDSIRDTGQDDPIKVTQDNVVFDGWHRVRACAELGLPVRATVYRDLTEEEIARKVIDAHSGRRNLSKLDLARYSVATMQACGMEFAKGRPEKGYQVDNLLSPEEKETQPITAQAVADDANVSKVTAQRAISEAKKSVEAPSDGVQRRAKASGQRAKDKREAAMADHQALLQETLEGTAARAHAAESELAARAGDPEIHEDAMEELARSNKALFQVVEDRAKQIAELREKLVTAERQVAYYKQYAAKLEEALQRGDA